MKYDVSFDASLKTLMQHLSPELKQKIKMALREISSDPYIGKALQEDLTGLYSCRILRFRIVYSIDTKKKRINIVTIGPRETVYDELGSWLNKR